MKGLYQVYHGAPVKFSVEGEELIFPPQANLANSVRFKFEWFQEETHHG